LEHKGSSPFAKNFFDFFYHKGVLLRTFMLLLRSSKEQQKTNWGELEMMNKMVEVKEMGLVGKVYDLNEKFVWVETSEDLYCVKAEMVAEIIEAAPEAAFEAALDAAGLEWNGFVDGDLQFTYVIKGSTYDLMASIDLEYNEFYMDTKHKGFEDHDWANKKSYKKIATLVKNIIKWADK
jgi:preprotein translocase subunit YajC